MGRWRFFTDAESEGMTDDICFKRDRAREFYGHAIEQTSGFRTAEHNALKGGAKDSAHLYGKGWDMKAPQDSLMRLKLAWALGRAGFDRVEFGKTHFHADTMNDASHPSPYVWEGPDF